MLSNEKEFQEQKKFKIVLVVQHPTLSPADITAELDLTPLRTKKVGERRSTPTGNPLPGIYKETTWTYVSEHNHEKFLVELSNFIDLLEIHEIFFQQIKLGGIIPWIAVYLPGSIHMGSVLPMKALPKLVKLGIQLGIEVFPDWDIDE